VAAAAAAAAAAVDATDAAPGVANPSTHTGATAHALPFVLVFGTGAGGLRMRSPQKYFSSNFVGKVS
jgi:hypothetical protein